MGSRKNWLTRACFVAVCSLLGVCGCGGGGGGGGGDPEVEIGAVVEAGLPQVDLPGRISVLVRVEATDESPVADLTEDNFIVLENDQEVSKTESKQKLLPKPKVFRSYSLVLLDRSGSITTSEEGDQQQINAAKAYVKLVTQDEESFIAIYWFDGREEIQEVVDFSADEGILLAALDDLLGQGPQDISTRLYGAIDKGLDELDAIELEASNEGVDFSALSLVTFTDGTDEAGTPPTFEEVRDRIDPPGGSGKYFAFTIGIKGDVDQEKLAALGPHGSVFVSISNLVPAFQDVAESVRDLANSYYYISYCSPKRHGSGDHTLTIRAQSGDSSATKQYNFPADYFGPGCAFLDTIEPELPTLAGRQFTASGATEDSFGRILVCGQAHDVGTDDRDAVVFRLMPDGSLDAAFGSNGIKTIASDFGQSSVVTGGVVTDGDNLYVCGAVSGPDVPQIGVWRMGVDGQILDSFTTAPLGTDGDLVNDIEVDSGGRVVVCGISMEAGNRSAVWRLTSDLELDLSFNQTGSFMHVEDPSFAFDAALALAIDPEDKIVVAGHGLEPTTGTVDLKVMRLSFNGTLDTSFSDDGIARNILTFQDDSFGAGQDVSLDSIGRIVVAGNLIQITSEYTVTPSLWRMNPDGSPDVSFQGSPESLYPGTGLVTLPTSLLNNPDIDFGLATTLFGAWVDTDDSVVCVGSRLNKQDHRDMAMWWFDASGHFNGDFNDVGFLIDDGATGDDSQDFGVEVLVHSQGRLIGIGQSTSQGGDSTAVVWIDPDNP